MKHAYLEKIHYNAVLDGHKMKSWIQLKKEITNSHSKDQLLAVKFLKPSGILKKTTFNTCECIHMYIILIIDKINTQKSNFYNALCKCKAFSA